MTARTLLMCTQTASAVGGVQTRIGHLVRELPAHGWEVVVGLAWGTAHHDPQQFLRQHSLRRTVLLDGRTGTETGRRRAVRDAIRRVKPDIVIPCMLADPFPILAGCKREDRGPRLVCVSGEISAPLLMDYRAYRNVIDQAVGVSRLTTRLLVEVAGLPQERVLQIPNGVRIPEQPSEVATPGQPLRLGYVGRLDPDKRALDLTDLCAELDRSRVSYHLTIVGSGQFAGEIGRRLGGHVARGVVTLHPPLPVESLYATIYPRLDCALLLSPAEGMPVAAMEAMAHGLVLVTSDFRGRSAEGLIRDGETGVVFPVGDMTAAARAIEHLAECPEERRRLGQAARAAVEADYSFSGMIDRWAQLLDEVMSRPPVCGETPVAAPRPAGRLDRLVGPEMAETVRRLLRRRFVHRDASEWPFCGMHTTEELADTQARIADVERELVNPASSVPT